uniref:Phospholipase A2 n=1 Tax=Meloidogyne incognita TaxID=6306 RepID=A0A914KXM3_MELIC
MVPKWSCGPSGDGKSKINDVEVTGCVHASYFCSDSALVELTKCCIVHDRCYNDKKGQTFCDDHFCPCLHKAAKHPGCYIAAAEAFCLLVRTVGGSAYNG